MQSSLQRLWGYTESGDAKVFLVPVGGKLPTGWSPDISVMPHELRDGTALTEKAGATVHRPIPVGDVQDDAPAKEHWKTRAKREREEAEKAEKPLRYDENCQQVVD